MYIIGPLQRQRCAVLSLSPLLPTYFLSVYTHISSNLSLSLPLCVVGISYFCAERSTRLTQIYSCATPDGITSAPTGKVNRLATDDISYRLLVLRVTYRTGGHRRIIDTLFIYISSLVI